VASHKTRMMRIILCGALLALAATEGWSSAFAGDTLTFCRPTGKGMPRAIASWSNSCLRLDMVASMFTKLHGGHTYIFVSSGVKPSGGYSVRVSRINRSSGRTLAVHVAFIAPPKGSATTQQLTRPYDLVAISDTGWAVNVIPEGNAKPFRIAGLVGVRELKSVVNESRAIKVFFPRSGSAVCRAFNVSGVALVFEGTVQMRLTTDGGQVLGRTFATAATALDWGYFDKQLSVPDSVPSGTSLRLEMYTLDEEKGGETNLVRTSLKLRRQEGE
jgi:hypothetical protein